MTVRSFMYKQICLLIILIGNEEINHENGEISIRSSNTSEENTLSNQINPICPTVNDKDKATNSSANSRHILYLTSLLYIFFHSCTKWTSK